MEGGKEANYWPGFVDALSNVVLTLVFVLVIFVFALLLESNKVEKKMEEVQASEKATQAAQEQLNQALAEVEKMRQEAASVDPASKTANGQLTQEQQSCLRFNKSDANQKAVIAADGLAILVSFNPHAISVTDDTNKSMHDFIDQVAQKNPGAAAKYIVESPEDPTSNSPLLTKETQLGRMLNLRNALLSNKIEARNIEIHYIAPKMQDNSYDWVEIHVEK